MQKHSAIYGLPCKNIIQDGVIRMATDGSSFRHMEEKWPHFKEEPRNIKISLAADGFNPFAEMIYVYTVFPIFFINNNIPPWLSIKREHIMLAMIIPGMCLQHFF